MLLFRSKQLRRIVGALETGNLLFLKLLWKRREMAGAYPGKVFRAYMSLVEEDRWHCRKIFDVIPASGALRIELEHLPSSVIETPLEQLACLALIAKAVEPSVIFEIGTFRGRTALNFARNSPKDCKVYTMDLPSGDRATAIAQANPADSRIIQESRTGEDYIGSDVEHKIEQIFADSQHFDFSPFYDGVDIVYIDGAHHYEAVRSDTMNALRIVRPGGYVLWDEFANYGDYNDVTRAVLDLIPADEIVQVENTQLAVYRKPQLV